MQDLISNLIMTLWTPVFAAIFLAILAYVLWPDNRDDFDHAARLPLRED
jgi:cytochrome c oxidase cbb3-type subunit IV